MAFSFAQHEFDLTRAAVANAEEEHVVVFIEDEPTSPDDVVYWQYAQVQLAQILTVLAGVFPLGAACAIWHADVFASGREEQQAAFDGDFAEEASAYEGALAICGRCEVREACERYARAGVDNDAFIAGMTGRQRLKRWGKQWEIASRRRLVASLADQGIPCRTIASMLRVSDDTVYRDLREIRPMLPASDVQHYC